MPGPSTPYEPPRATIAAPAAGPRARRPALRWLPILAVGFGLLQGLSLLRSMTGPLLGGFRPAHTDDAWLWSIAALLIGAEGAGLAAARSWFLARWRAAIAASAGQALLWVVICAGISRYLDTH